MNYVKASVAKKELQITGVTLMRWKNEGLIKYKKLSSKKFLYDIDSVDRSEQQTGYNTKNVIYARVSTSGQKNDLDNQIEIIKGYMISNGMKVDHIYQDIASGMNENRKQFRELLDSVFKREVNTVYITFKDRLIRFGFDYFKDIFMIIRNRTTSSFRLILTGRPIFLPTGENNLENVWRSKSK